MSQNLPCDPEAFEESCGNPGFILRLSDTRNNIFIPKYYDPTLEEDVRTLARSYDLVTLGELVTAKVLEWETGVEVGKMAYGTGPIPFIRTSDISNWELKGDPKQSVSEEVYDEYRQDVQPGDIFVVRDGTYLVGTSCMVTEHDERLLYCGGLYRLRVVKRAQLDPYLLLAALNAPIVRRQMRARQFTRDVIDTIGKRLFEVAVPIPKEVTLRNQVADETRLAIETRGLLRNRAKAIALEVEGIEAIGDEEEILAAL